MADQNGTETSVTASSTDAAAQNPAEVAAISKGKGKAPAPAADPMDDDDEESSEEEEEADQVHALDPAPSMRQR